MNAPVFDRGRRFEPDRVFLPGGQWFYAKLYTHHDLLTDLVARHLPSALDHLFALPRSTISLVADGPVGAACSTVEQYGTGALWFFSRYGDPDPHLRLRIRLAGPDQWAETLAAQRRWAEKLLDANLIRRVEIGTYEQETHRYGGRRNIEAAERVFAADSADCVTLLTGPYRGAQAMEQMAAHVASMWVATGDDDVVIAAARGAMIVKRHVAGYRQKKTAQRLYRAGEPLTGNSLVPVRIAEYFRGLRASGVSARDRVYIAASLSHMHANRAGASPDTEGQVVDTATTIIRSLTRPQATRRRQTTT